MGSLTACVKKAGSALKAEDKAAIMAAARENRKAGMSASEAGRKAVEARLAEVRAMITSAAAAPRSVDADVRRAERPRVYQSRQAAQAARKELGNTKRVQKTRDGYILRDATDKELAASEKAGKRLAGHGGVDVEKDSLLAAIAKLGGLSIKDRRDIIGSGNRNVGGKMLFTGRGKAVDLMASEDLLELGYVPQREVDRDGGTTWLRDAVRDEFMGLREHYSERGIDAIMEAEQQREAAEYGEEVADFDVDDLESSGYIAAAPHVQAATEQLIAEANAAGIDTETIAEDAAKRAEGLTEDEYHAEFQAALTEALAAHRRNAAGTDSAGARPGDADRRETARRQGEEGQAQGLTLEAQEASDLRAKAEREARAKELDERAQVDAERDLFGLQAQTAPEQRRDNTGDMFGGPSAEDLQAAAKREREKGATRQQGPDLFDAPAESAPAKPADRQAEQPASRIDDVGEKIGGARKDTAESTGPRRSSASEDDRPAWARRFKVSQIVRPGGQINAVRDEGRWVIRDSRSTDWTGQPKQVGRDTFATKEEAEAFVPIAAVGLKHRAVPVIGDKYEIWRDITDRKRVKVLDRKFDTRDEAMAYMAAHAVEIIETNTTFGEADLPLPPDRARRGPPRRDGNVKGEDFKDAFGFRAVEFGLWNNQDERQALMNDAWDGLMDLADVLGVPPRALGLNGDLALAFGARGHGLQSARAHYENDRAVINLTKEKGAGSLAHEFFHGLDHYFGRQDGKASAKWEVQPDGTRTLKAKGAEDDFLSGGSSGNRSGVRPELRAAYEALLQTMTKKAERYVEDMAKVDKFTGVAREELAQKLDALRRELSAQKDPTYYKRNNKPASAELLAEFDAIAAKMVAGEMLTTDWRTFAKGAEKRAQLAARWTNDALERLSAIYKEVRGRSGFDTTTREGVLDKLRGYMDRYSQRLKMLADAQAGGEKTRMVPTEFAMNARELDQGRGGDYWTSPHEMAARAFQGYVEDKIAEKGGVSRFLNYGPENVGIPTPWGFKRPFPAGAERKAINAAFDKFIGALQTREDDAGNVAMFSRATPRDTVEYTEDGLPTFHNDRVSIDYPHDVGSTDAAAELGERVAHYAIMANVGFDSYGYVDLLVREGKPIELQRIYIKPEHRGSGIAAQAVEAILAGFPSADLKISNIVESAKGFWSTMGVAEQPRVPGVPYDGTLNWQAYSEAQDRSGGRADHGRGGSADQERDAGTTSRIRGSASQAQAGRQQGLTLPALQRFVQALSDAGITGVNAVQSVADMPAGKRDAALRSAPDGNIRGAYFKSDGSVWLVADHLASAQEAAFVVMHEAFHRGLMRELGTRGKVVLRQMHASNQSLREATAKQMADHKIGLDEAIEEALADLAGQGKARDLKGFDRLMRLIRKYLAKVGEALGIQITWTDEMVEDFVAGIRRSGLRDGVHVAQAEVAPMLSRAGTAATLDNLRQTKMPGGYILADLMKSSGKVSWWSRTVGTMHHLAEREPLFKPVYDAAQRFLEDVSKYATEAADLAPHLLPKLETLRDITKSPLSAEDTKAISAPIFEGTLSWVRNEKGQPVKIETAQKTAAGLSADDKGRAMLRSGAISENVLKMWQGLPLEQYEAAIETRYQSQMLRPGVVWTDAELKAMFRLSEAQIGLYREALKSANQSLSHLAASDMVRFAGRDAEIIRDAVMRAKTLDEAHDLLVQHLIKVRDADPDRADVINDTINRLADKAERAKDLMARGYYPLMRFGKYTVDVLDADGERLYFSMFETEREANKMARALVAEFPKAKISQGTMSQQQYQMFAGVSPETLELFGDMLGFEATGDRAMDKAFQEFIKLTKSNRSAMKRLIERKGIAGFSEDAGRVLASFVYSNARQTSKNLHFGPMTDAVMAIADEKGEGELLDSAVRLHKYVANPQEEAQALRGLLFAQFLGGSIAAGLVNLTQPVMVTFPYLTQWGGVTKAALRMRKALADAVKWETDTKTTGNAKLDAAIKDAEERGIISPQEVHSLIAQAGGSGALKSGDGTTVGDMLAHVSNAKSKLMLAWGKPFSVAEQFNRRATFIAAWRTAVEESIDNPTAFAEKAIDDTQFTYNKGNRPEWARGAIGGTLFTFKTFSISYVELMTRMAKSGPEGRRAAAVGLAMLILASGLQGVPGADDLDDIIDGLMQRLGYNWSSKQKKREALAAMFGEDIGDFVMRGVSGLPGAPIDVAGRLGLGNLIPGTGLLTKKTDYGRDVAEIGGPFGALAQQVGTAGSKIVEGEFGAALKAIMPVAGQNIAQAVDMASMGMYRDRDGKKVIDTDAADAVFKAIGFQPRDVAKVQNAAREQQGLIALNKMRETEIADKWARGIFEGDRDMVAEAQGELKAWNADNSESPIRIQTQQIVKRLQAMRMTRAERLEKTAPREIRASVRRELEAVQ